MRCVVPASRAFRSLCVQCSVRRRRRAPTKRKATALAQDCEPDVKEICRRAFGKLERSGAETSELEIPELFEAGVAHRIAIVCEMTASAVEHFNNHYEDMVRLASATGNCRFVFFDLFVFWFFFRAVFVVFAFFAWSVVWFIVNKWVIRFQNSLPEHQKNITGVVSGVLRKAATKHSKVNEKVIFKSVVCVFCCALVLRFYYHSHLFALKPPFQRILEFLPIRKPSISRRN